MKQTNIEVMSKNGYRRMVDIDSITSISETSTGSVINLVGGALIFTTAHYSALKELVLERTAEQPEPETEHDHEDYEVTVEDSGILKFSLIGDSEIINNIADAYQLDIQGSEVLNEYHSVLQFEAREDDVMGISPMFLMRGWK